MGLVVNFSGNLEDRFNVAIRDRKHRNYAPTLNLDYEDVGETLGDESTKGCNYHFSIHPIQYNNFLDWLKDIQDIMGITFKFRYTYSKKEAYTGYSDNNFCKHQWLKFN